MKIKKNVQKKGFIKEAKDFMSLIDTCIIYAFLVCMLGILPLFYENRYQFIGSIKYNVFAKTSRFFLVVELILIMIRICLYIYQHFKGESIDYLLDEIKKRSFLDMTVMVYGVCVIISFFLSKDKTFALNGADGWNMGLYSQLVFVGIYFLISWKKQWLNGILELHLLSSGIVFLLGILHRFHIDPLNMYVNLSLEYKIEFISTIGQATWYSSYMCTVFAIGVAIFYLCKDLKMRILTGIYTVLCFATFVTQNSDSAYIAIAGIYLLLGYFSLRDKEKWLRFLQLIIVMFGTFAGVGLLQRVFADRIIPLDSLSIFFSQSIFTWCVLVFSLVIYFLFKNMEEEKMQRFIYISRKIYVCVPILVVIGIVGLIVFIYLNTSGYLLEKFNYQSSNMYLYFNNYWGNHRGFNWSIAMEAYKGFPFVNKLFGIGPDSFASYLYNVPEIGDKIRSYYPNLRLTNAHCEYLNSLICYGAIGLISWLTVLIGGIRYFYNKAKDNPFMIAFALCIMGYACHNIFCYQQVCCTPFLFIALGIGESLTKSENFNTIK